MRTLIASLLAALILVGGIPEARAQRDHDQAREAVRKGQIRPLNEILGAAQRQVPGRVLGVDLRGGGSGPYVYDIKMLTPDGDVVLVSVDARTASVIGVRGQAGGRGGSRERRR